MWHQSTFRRWNIFIVENFSRLIAWLVVDCSSTLNVCGRSGYSSSEHDGVHTVAQDYLNIHDVSDSKTVLDRSDRGGLVL